MRYSDYKCFSFRFDSGVAFVSIDHPPINLLDEVLSQEFDKLGRELEADDSVRVVVLQSALPDFFIAHSGLGRVGAASKMVSHTRSFRLTQTIGERFRNMPKVTAAKHMSTASAISLPPPRARPSILAIVTLGMFLNRSPIVCVRRKLRVWDTILEAAPTRPNPEWAIKKSGSALCKTTTRTLSSASSSLPSLSNSCDRTSSRRFIGG